MKIQGTPKSLIEALIQGLQRAAEEGLELNDIVDQTVLASVLEPHVRDFLSQRFGVALMKEEMKYGSAEVTQALWESILKKEVKS